MLERLDIIERDFLDLESSMATAEVLENQDKLREVSRKYKQLTPLVECIRKYQAATGNAQAAKELIADATGAERDQLQEELISATSTIAALENELKILLLPPDPNAGKNIIVEIRGAEGGEGEGDRPARPPDNLQHTASVPASRDALHALLGFPKPDASGAHRARL